MSVFKYTAKDPSGKVIKGEIEAGDERLAGQAIIRQGLSPIKLTSKDPSNSLINRFRNRVPTKEKVVFARQLATLVNASLPLLQSLRLVAEQTSANKYFQGVINDIGNQIEGGVPFSRALSKYSDIFGQVFIGVVAAGEASGTLDASLERLAIQQERDADIVSKVRGAAVYPLIVMIVMLGVIAFMVVKVLPQVQNMYSGLPGASMPFITRFLLSIAHATIDYWWMALFGGALLGFFFRRWSQTENGIDKIDGLKMRLPVIGRLFKKLYMARFSRIASTLLASGLPLLQVLQVTAGAIDNTHVAASINSAAEKVRGGKSLSDSLVGDPNFLDLVPNMLKIGEQSGALETMMSKTADYYEKEVDEEVDTLSTTIEPVLMIMMGVMALVVVAAILLPIYSLVGKNINVV